MKIILPINRCITDPKEWPMPKVGRSCTCVESHYCFLSVISFRSEINYMIVSQIQEDNSLSLVEIENTDQI